MVYNLTPQTPNMQGFFSVVNTGTGEWFIIIFLLLVYITTFLLSIRSGSLNPFLPTSMVGAMISFFLYIAGLLNPAITIICILLFVVTIGLTFSQSSNSF